MKTERLTLRIIQKTDASFLHQLMNTEKWHAFIGDRGIDSINSAQRYMDEKMSPILADKGFMNHVMLLTETQQAIGTCSLHDRDGVEGLDIGYALLPNFEGYGFATEGAKAMIQLAFETYGQEQVSAITTDANHRSCSVLEKLGFKFDRYIQLPGSNEQIKLYLLYKSSFSFVKV